MELGLGSAPGLSLFKMPYLAAHLGESDFRERRSTLYLHKVWEAARGSKQLPYLMDFDLALIERVGSACFLLEFERDAAGAKFKYFGRDLAAAVKRDLTGFSIAAVPHPSLLAHLVPHCAEVVQSGKPLVLDGVFTEDSTEHLLYRCILLPFARDGEKAECVLGSVQFRRMQATQSIASTDITRKLPLIVHTGGVNRVPSPASIAHLEQFKTALSRAREQATILNAEEATRGKQAEKILSALQRRICRAVWPANVIRFMKSAPAVGKAVMPARDDEFALLLARCVDVKSGRYEIVAVADKALLNMAMRSAAAKLQRSRVCRRKRHRTA